MTPTSTLHTSLSQLRRQWRATPLPAFLAWWGGQLRALLPASWRRALSRGAVWYLVDIDADTLRLRRSGHADVLASVVAGSAPELQRAAVQDACAHEDPADLHLALCLPAAAVLRRRLNLPLAALDNLPQVLAFEMDRQTPFAATQVYYDARELAPVSGGMVAVELVAAPRAGVDPQLARLAAAGIAIDAVDVTDGDGRLGVNLLPPPQRRPRAHPRRRLNLALAALAVLLTLAVMVAWLGNRSAALADMQARVDALQAQSRTVAALRKQLNDSLGAAGFLVQRKAQLPHTLAVLEDLSQRLPDDTWLERLSIGDGRVGLQGQSPQAASLVGQLKDSALLRDPGFQGVIQKDPATGKERFYLVAQLRAPATTEPAHAPEAR